MVRGLGWCLLVLLLFVVDANFDSEGIMSYSITLSVFFESRYTSRAERDASHGLAPTLKAQ